MNQNTLPTCFYIHIPFCPSGCEFCHFFTDAGKRSGYIELLKKEYSLRFGEKNFDFMESIFIGGGTPNMLSLEEMRSLLIFIKSTIKKWKEFSIELHPALISKELIYLLHEYGVTRISIGIQTIDPKILSQHTRIQLGYNKLIEHISLIQELGIIINLDFIYNLIGDSLESIKKNISFIRETQPDSIYYYQLRPFTEYIKTNYLPDEKERLKQYAYIQHSLISGGYDQVNHATYVQKKYNEITTLEYDKILYGGHHTLIGLGVAATNHIGNTMTKNTIKYDVYKERIEAGALATDLEFSLSEGELCLSILGHIFLSHKTIDIDHLLNNWQLSKDSLTIATGKLLSLGYMKEIIDNTLELTPKGLYYQEDIIKDLFSENKECFSRLTSL